MCAGYHDLQHEGEVQEDKELQDETPHPSAVQGRWTFKMLIK